MKKKTSKETSEGPSVQYLMHYFNSPSTISFMLRARVATAQPNMSLADTREFPIPFPPLAEQRRIVSKVDELMTLRDRLEACLTAGEGTRSRLLDALLHEALEPMSREQAAAA